MTKILSVFFAAASVFLPAGSLCAQSLDAQQSEFLTLINNFRAQNGVGPLQVSATLQQSAQWMSNDMATNNYFSHTDSLGRDPFERMAAFGYSYYPEGENIAAGNSDAQSTFTQFQTACDPDASGNCTYAHAQNMLDSAYAAIGIGLAYSSKSTYGWYWTTDFGAVVDQTLSNPPPPASVPSIASFTATPSTVTAGQSATLSWSVTGASTLTINNGVGDVSRVTFETVAPGQTTIYTLTATNSAGSSIAQTTVTVSTPQSTGPGAPVLSSAIASSSVEVDLAWIASASSAGIASYQILRNNSVLAAVSGTTLSYADASVSAGATYTYAVRAIDSNGNTSPESNTIQVTVPGPPASGNTCSPPASGSFTGCYYNNVTLSGSPSLVRNDPQINFDWGGNPPARGVSRGSFSVRWQGNFTFAAGTYQFSAVTSDGMRLYIDGVLVLNKWNDQPPTMYNVEQALSQGTHLLTVEYYEETGISSAHLTWQAAAPVVTLPAILSFTAAPSTIAFGQTSVLAWSVTGASTVTITNVTSNISGVTSVTVQPALTTTYALTVSNSAGSSTAQVTVTVTAAPDSQPPTSPVLISAVLVSSSQVNLTWSASSDNVAVAGYQILRNGSALVSVSPATLAYSDTAVSPGATYTYTIKAFDAAGNYSTASNAIQVVVPAAPPASNSSCPTVAVGAFTGCYYPNVTLSGAPTFVRTDAQINFDWASNVPDRSLPRDNFSVLWQGSFTFAQGTYTFSALTSDGMRLYIDGTLVMDHWVNQAATQYTFTQALSAGSHVITVDYYEETGWSAAHVTWQHN
jgi:uncharacterized protein YkwD/chitodextrinase